MAKNEHETTMFTGPVRRALSQLVRDLRESWSVRGAPELQLRDYPVSRRV